MEIDRGRSGNRKAAKRGDAVSCGPLSDEPEDRIAIEDRCCQDLEIDQRERAEERQERNRNETVEKTERVKAEIDGKGNQDIVREVRRVPV